MNERRGRRPGRPSTELKRDPNNRTWYIISLILVGVIVVSMVISALIPSTTINPSVSTGAGAGTVITPAVASP